MLIHEGGRRAATTGCPGFPARRRHREKIRQGRRYRRFRHTHQAYVCEIDGRLVTSVTIRHHRHRHRSSRSEPRHRHRRANNTIVRTAPYPRTRTDRADRILRQGCSSDRQPSGRVDHRNAVARPQQYRREPAWRHYRRCTIGRDQRVRSGAVMAFTNPAVCGSTSRARKTRGHLLICSFQPFRNQLVTLTLTGSRSRTC